MASYEEESHETFEDLAVQYNTGRGVTIGKGKDIVRSFRVGVMTKAGDLELSEWAERVKELIQQEGEQKLFDALHEWVSMYPFLHGKKNVELYALELHASRIFDNPAWVDYQAFNEKYHRSGSVKEETTSNV